MQFVDSHLHLEGQSDFDEISTASSNNILLVTCGTDRQTSLGGIELALGHPEVIRAFVGIHPSEALKEEDPDWVKTALKSATGVGEIGLDPKYSSIGSRSRQMIVFRSLLGAAEDAEKPVQIHSRGAEAECLEILSQFDPKSVLMHWFQDEERLGELMGRGYCVTFGPALTYSKRLQRMAARANHDLVLVETDYPVPYAPLGRVKGPSLVPSVVFKIADLWGLGFDEVKASIARNSARFLGMTEKG